ncbi:hypothetical protein P4S73_20305 [Paraglaciecola sp. Hal342]
MHVALGNAPYSQQICEVLTKLEVSGTDLVKEHAQWALKEQETKKQLSLEVVSISDDTDTDDSLLPKQAQRLNQRLIRSIEKGSTRDALNREIYGNPLYFSTTSLTLLK